MHSYKTIHPLSKLPYNITRDLLVEKYCKLLELYHIIKNEIKILKDENIILKINYNNINNNDINDFNLPIENTNIKDDNIPIENTKIVNNNNIKNINIINIKGDKIEPIKEDKIEPIKGDQLGDKIESIKGDQLGDKIVINTNIKVDKNVKNKVYEYYKNKGIIDRIRLLKCDNKSIRSIENILNNEGYLSNKGDYITKKIVEKIIANYL
jgi:hypothetical protein